MTCLLTHLDQIDAWSFVIIDFVNSNQLTDLFIKSLNGSHVYDIHNKLESHDTHMLQLEEC